MQDVNLVLVSYTLNVITQWELLLSRSSAHRQVRAARRRAVGVPTSITQRLGVLA
jgi:hypothetical protein